MNDVTSISWSRPAGDPPLNAVEDAPEQIDVQTHWFEQSGVGPEARQFEATPSSCERGLWGQDGDGCSGAGANGRTNRYAENAMVAVPSKNMHGHPAHAASKEKSPRAKRISVALGEKRLRHLARMAAENKCDMSALVAAAVEAVHGRGAQYVQLRASAEGLTRVLLLLTLVDNRIEEIADVIGRRQSNGMSETAFRVVALARLESIHAGLVSVTRLVASWRAHDHAAAESFVGADSSDMSPCGGGGGI